MNECCFVHCIDAVVSTPWKESARCKEVVNGGVQRCVLPGIERQAAPEEGREVLLEGDVLDAGRWEPKESNSPTPFHCCSRMRKVRYLQIVKMNNQ